MASARPLPADKSKWRVHAGAAGFGALGALIEPLKTEPVDCFLLLERPGRDLARDWFKERNVDVVRKIKSAGVAQVEVVATDLWDPMAVGNALLKKVRQEAFAGVSVNVSTGPNPVGIGAALASVFWDLRLYYAVSDFSQPPVSEIFGHPHKGIGWLPTFHSDAPRPEVLAALEALGKEKAGLSSSRFKAVLRGGETPIIRPRGDDPSARMKPQAVHGQFLTIVKHLAGWHLVDEETRHRQKHFRITEEGRAFLRLFDGLHDFDFVGPDWVPPPGLGRP